MLSMLKCFWHKKPKIVQNDPQFNTYDLNDGVSMASMPFIYRRYHVLKSPPLRDNINFFCIMSRHFFFLLWQVLQKPLKIIPMGSLFWMIFLQRFRKHARIAPNNYSMEHFRTFYHYIDLIWAENDLKYYDVKWNFELGSLLNGHEKKAYFKNISWGGPPGPPTRGCTVMIMSTPSPLRGLDLLSPAGCAPYSLEIPSYSESCGQPCQITLLSLDCHSSGAPH